MLIKRLIAYGFFALVAITAVLMPSSFLHQLWETRMPDNPGGRVDMEIDTGANSFGQSHGVMLSKLSETLAGQSQLHRIRIKSERGACMLDIKDVIVYDRDKATLEIWSQVYNEGAGRYRLRTALYSCVRPESLFAVNVQNQRANYAAFRWANLEKLGCLKLAGDNL